MRALLILILSVAAWGAPGGWTGAIWIQTRQSETGKHVEDPKKTWRRDLNLSLDCKVEGSTARCALVGSSSFKGEDSSIDSSASGSVAPHVGVSISGGRISLSIGVVTVRGKNSVTVAGTRMDEEKDMNFGPWRAEGAASPGSTQAGKWSDEKGITTITWRLTKRD